MATIERSFEKLGVKTGLVTCMVLIAYFLLMRAVNLVHVTELRYFNFVILLGGLIYGYRHFRESDQNVPYLPGLGLGILTTAVSVLPFAAFLFVYFSFLDPGLLEVLRNSPSVQFAEYLTPLAISNAIVVEGLSSGLIISFTLMQYYKSHAHREKGAHDFS